MQSVWSESIKNEQHKRIPMLEQDIKTDVLVIGGGMAGILTAYRLQQAGVKCVVAEAETVGGGITKNTTAKVTAQHGLIYSKIIGRQGVEAAKSYFAANQQAVADFKSLSEKYPCDFEEKSAFVYSTNRRDVLEQEAQAYQKIGLAADILDALSLPFPVVGAIELQHQGQIHPLKLLCALAENLDIYENTFVKNIAGGVAETEKGKIYADHIVLATHYPLVNIPGLYFMKLYQHRSYVIALEGAGDLSGMYVDWQQDGYSFRTYQNLLLLGGGGHRTGKQGGGYVQLRNFVKKTWPHAKQQFCWATQDCMSLDNMPYIGRHRAGSRNLYVATGMSKWGMTGSMVASRILSDLIVYGKSDLEALYSPRRPMAGLQLASNLCSAAAGLLRVGGPRCTHMGCKLNKNCAEGTWDCACHGSRFDAAGHVIDNPAKRRAHL